MHQPSAAQRPLRGPIADRTDEEAGGQLVVVERWHEQQLELQLVIGQHANAPSGDPQPPNTPGPGGTCAAEANADGCFECCAKGNEAGLDQAYQIFDTCACQTPGVCKTQCGSNYCAGQQPTAACETCLQGAQQCGQQADQACAANAQCKAAMDCFDASQCENKP